jgi:N utilization substance protein B
MGTRREGRELAVQAIYQLEVTNDEAGQSLQTFWVHFDAGDEAGTFARALVDQVQRDRRRIDSLIADATEHWRVGRLSKVDLSVLRVATCELIGSEDIPTRVTIDEAIEIARRFGSEDSSAFVNGVLDRIADVLGVKGRGDE